MLGPGSNARHRTRRRRGRWTSVALGALLGVAVLAGWLVGPGPLLVTSPEGTSASVTSAGDRSTATTGARAPDPGRGAGVRTAPPDHVEGTVIEPWTREQILARKARKEARKQRREAREERRKERRQERREAAEAAKEPAAATFTVGTFNVLGSQHTRPGGPRSHAFPPAARRTPKAAGLARAHGVDVLGLQELKPDQLAGLRNRLGMEAFPGHAFGSRDTDNSILWDPQVFEKVSGGSFTIKFMNARRPQTVLRLRHRASGREMYFLNMHASAGGGRHAVSRRNGHQTAVAQVNRLKQEGLPIFLTGDMNDRAEFFCRVAPPTGMVAPYGGSTSGGCQPGSPPGGLAVDWILSTSGVSWSGYRHDKSPRPQGISDHPFVSATATVGGD